MTSLRLPNYIAHTPAGNSSGGMPLLKRRLRRAWLTAVVAWQERRLARADAEAMRARLAVADTKIKLRTAQALEARASGRPPAPLRLVTEHRETPQ